MQIEQRTAISRRSVLRGTAAVTTLAAVAPLDAWAQGEPIRLGTLTPLTGAGGAYGPSMREAMEKVVQQVNGAGGVLGRQITLYSEDDETNPDAAVRAAHKLIDVNKVIAVMGTWASSVTSAVAPVCWQSQTFLTCTSGANSITQLPHQGYIIRTEPISQLQSQKMAEYMLELGAKKIFVLGAQTPFQQLAIETVTKVAKAKGVEVGSLIYDVDKTSFRSEVDQALRTQPDMLFLNGYQPDVTIILKDLYRAGYNGKKIGQAYAINAKTVDATSAEVAEGAYSQTPWPAINSSAYKRVTQLLGKAEPDPYSCQTYDHANLVILAVAKAGSASGTAIRDNVRKISQDGATKVDNAVDGLKLLAAGKDINYEGASGPCKFNEIGDVVDATFRYAQIRNGKVEVLKVA